MVPRRGQETVATSHKPGSGEGCQLSPISEVGTGSARGPRALPVPTSEIGLNWRPTIAQAGTSNLFTVVVTEGGWLTNLMAVADAYVRDGSYSGTTNLLDWAELFTTNFPALPFDWLDADTNALPLRFYRVRLAP